MTSPSRLSLFTIEESLQLLAETREAAEAEEDTAAIVECDKALAEYLTSEAAKVDSYAALIRRTTFEAECCASEEARIAARRKQLVAFADRLKANALEVMQRFDIKELKSPTCKLRRQQNGGVDPLEITGPALEMPKSCQQYTVVMNGLAYSFIRDLCGDAPQAVAVLDSAVCVPSPTMIRAALRERVVCPECKGAFIETKCPRCEGTGHIAATVPGAKLLPRGEHVRLS